jgi:putative nucleotidyltransferase with HDIG domain
LFNDLQQSNFELTLAYDATIAGWSRAMDLRDKETEGHTQRVTDLTLKLARAMNISEAQLTHIRQGALLHDIGKMGVPDNILLKADTLTDEEWEKMRKHPDFAYEMLSSIRYLQPALDIPYCHHEKWDGSGYPRGLKGAEIPIAARIFAVADVWDAITSDRPYRNSWSKEAALEYIKEQSGKYFDPQVVEWFLELISNQ